jgi:hypothetical protein
MWHANNYEIQQLQQQEYLQGRRREADMHRRIKQAQRARGMQVSSYAEPLNRLGGYLVQLGERLQARDDNGARSEPIR